MQYAHGCKSKIYICDALRDLVPFVQFKKREKQPWKSVTFSEVAGFTTKSNTHSTILKLY